MPAARPAWHLHRAALETPATTLPLPNDARLREDVPALIPLLIQASKGERPTLRVDRDVAFGQLTRLMQAALGVGWSAWSLTSEDATGAVRVLDVVAPGPRPPDACAATAWLGADGRIQIGVDGRNVLIRRPSVARSDAPADVDGAATVLRRLDAKCATGALYLSGQPSLTWGAVSAFAFAIADVASPPHVAELHLAVPSVSALDSIDEIFGAQAVAGPSASRPR